MTLFHALLGSISPLRPLPSTAPLLVFYFRTWACADICECIYLKSISSFSCTLPNLGQCMIPPAQTLSGICINSPVWSVAQSMFLFVELVPIGFAGHCHSSLCCLNLEHNVHPVQRHRNSSVFRHFVWTHCVSLVIVRLASQLASQPASIQISSPFLLRFVFIFIAACVKMVLICSAPVSLMINFAYVESASYKIPFRKGHLAILFSTLASLAKSVSSPTTVPMSIAEHTWRRSATVKTFIFLVILTVSLVRLPWFHTSTFWDFRNADARLLDAVLSSSHNSTYMSLAVRSGGVAANKPSSLLFWFATSIDLMLMSCLSPLWSIHFTLIGGPSILFKDSSSARAFKRLIQPHSVFLSAMDHCCSLFIVHFLPPLLFSPIHLLRFLVLWEDKRQPHFETSAVLAMSCKPYSSEFWSYSIQSQSHFQYSSLFHGLNVLHRAHTSTASFRHHFCELLDCCTGNRFSHQTSSYTAIMCTDSNVLRPCYKLSANTQHKHSAAHMSRNTYTHKSRRTNSTLSD